MAPSCTSRVGPATYSRRCDGAPHVLAAADLTAVTGRERDIQTIDADPPVAGLQRLVGVRAGSGLRSAIARELPEEVEGGTPVPPP